MSLTSGRAKHLPNETKLQELISNKPTKVVYVLSKVALLFGLATALHYKVHKPG